MKHRSRLHSMNEMQPRRRGVHGEVRGGKLEAIVSASTSAPPRSRACIGSSRSRCSSDRRGFTLIELILAITISVVLAWTLYSAMYSALHARKSAEAAVEPTRAGAIAADLMRQDFDNVPPPTGILAGPFEGLHSSGQAGADSDDVQFYTIGTDEPADGSPLEDGIRKVELTISTDYSPPALVRRVTRNLLSSAEPLVNEEVLCRNVRGFSLTYFDGYTWQDSWDSTADNVLPLAVSMTLQLDDSTAADPQQTPPRTITRVFPLACGKISDDAGLGGM